MSELRPAREIDGAPLFDGITKSMMWQPDTDAVYLVLDDERENKRYLHVLADTSRANEVFKHPFRFLTDADLIEYTPGTPEQVES